MKYFKYTCMDYRGKKIKGSLQAPNIDACRTYLFNKNLNVTNIKESGQLISKLTTYQLTKVIDDKELVDFLTNMSILIASGLRLDDAIEVYTQQTSAADKRGIYFDLYFRVLEGDSLSNAMSRHPKDFPTILIKMIESGEESSSLVSVFESSAAYFQDRGEIKVEIIKIFQMPVLYLLAVIGVVIGMSRSVFPMYADLFDGFDAEVPVYLQFFIDANAWFDKWWIVLASVIGGLIVFLFVMSKRRENSAKLWNQFTIHLPIVGTIIKQYYQAYIATTLAQLTNNKVNLYDALQFVEPTINNYVYRKLLQDMVEVVRSGSSISNVLNFNPALDDIFIKMVNLGESSGNINLAFNNLDLYYDKTVILSIRKLGRRIQPILMIIIYAVVVLLVLAVMIPSMSVMTYA